MAKDMGVEGIDYIVCRVCGAKARRLDNRHLPFKHGISSVEYLERFPEAPLMCSETRRKYSKTTKEAWSRGDHSSGETTRKKSRAATAAWKDPDRHHEMSGKIKESWDRGDHEGAWTEELRVRQSRKIRQWCENNPDEVQANMRRAREAKVLLGNRAVYTDEVRARMSESVKEAWRRGDYDGVFDSPTSIEIDVSRALDEKGIRHISQYRPKGYYRIYDEFVPPRTLIEVQGSYWHTLPDMQERDIEKARWAHQNGYFVVAIWDFQLEEYGADFLVENWILPLSSTKGVGAPHMERLF